MFLTNPFAGAFGLDIGERSIKLVQLSRQRVLGHGTALKAELARSIALPSGYIVNGEVEQPEMVRQKLLTLLGKIGSLKPLRVPWVVALLPEQKTFLKTLELDIPPGEITAEDITFNAKKHLPFELEEYYLDWQIVHSENGRAERRSRVIVGASAKVLADAYTYLLESVGLSPLAFEIEACALVRALAALETESEAQVPQLFIDISATRSSLIIYAAGVPEFSVSANFSGELLTAILMRELKFDYAAAENYKIKSGLSYDKKYPRAFQALLPTVTDFIAEIKKTCSFYEDHSGNGEKIKQLVLSGGGANLLQLAETLERELKIPIATAAPGSGLLRAKKLSDFDPNDPGFSVAIGLARRAVENPLATTTRV